MSDHINIKDILYKTNISNVLIKALAKKSGIDESILQEKFDMLVDQKINDIGKTLYHIKDNIQDKNTISPENLLDENIKIIKDE
jgi:hypothetical protein